MADLVAYSPAMAGSRGKKKLLPGGAGGAKGTKQANLCPNFGAAYFGLKSTKYESPELNLLSVPHTTKVKSERYLSSYGSYRYLEVLDTSELRQLRSIFVS